MQQLHQGAWSPIADSKGENAKGGEVMKFELNRFVSVLMSAIVGLGGVSLVRAAEVLEEIVVEAQKREQSLRDVPVAVSVLNSEQIEDSFSNDIENLQRLVPSLSFRKGNTTRNSALTVRGIGTISFSIAAEPSVATVVDGVVLGRSGQTFSDLGLYNIERIEVLRGPQGTLFGKNASAGVVNIITQRPSDTFEASAEAGVFEDDEYRLKGYVSGPLTDELRASLTVAHSEFDGYIDNVHNNQEVNGYDRDGARAKLEYSPEDDLTILAIAEFYDANDDCCADLEGLPSGRNPASEAAPESNGIVNGEADIDLDQRRVDHDFETVTEDQTRAFSLQIDKRLGDFNLTSITAWRTWENTEFREGDFTSIGGDADEPVFDVPFQLHDIGPQEWDQFSQEIRLASPAGERLEYQVGAYFANIESERSFTRFASCQNNGGQNDAILAANPGLTCNASDIVDATAFMSTDFENTAVFGQATYSVLDQLRVLFGARFTHDEVSFEHNRFNNDPFGRQGVGVRPAEPNSQFPPASGGFNSNFDNSTDNNDFSFKAGIQWDFIDGAMAYATFAEGYKGPGFNVFFNMGNNDTLPIAEESSDAWEVGLKYASPNFVANLALFNTDIDGFQANNFDDSTGVTITRLTNAGSVTTEGVELDLIWNATEYLTFSGGVAVVDAEIDKFNCPIGEACTERSGLDVPFAPDVKTSVTGNYVLPLSNLDMDLIFNASYTYTDDQVSTLPNNDGTFSPAVRLPDYHMVNASIGLATRDDRYRVTVVGKNLLDDEFATTFSGDGFRYQIPREADRYFGVNVRANFF